MIGDVADPTVTIGDGTTDRTKLTSVAVVALSVATVVSLSPYKLVTWSPPGRNYFTATILLPADVALGAVLVCCLPWVVRGIRDRRVGPGAAGWAAVTAIMLVTFPWHPSGRGVLTLLHLGGCAMLAAATALVFLSDRRKTLAKVIVGAGMVEALIALLQVRRQGAIGLGRVIEVNPPYYPFEYIRAPNATFPHPYVAAGFALVSAAVAVVMAITADEAAAARWAAAAALCILPVGVSYSRSALLGLLGFGVCLAWLALRQPAIRKAVVGALIALAIGAAVPAAIWHTQWLARGSATVDGALSGGAKASSGIANGRLTDLHRALTLIREHPITGIGAGRYIFAIEHHFGVDKAPTDTGYVNANDVPLLAGAEGGVLALLVIAGALAWLGWRAARCGPLALGMCLAFLPYCLADQFPYESAQGAVICALWLALVDTLIVSGGSRWSRSESG